MRGIAAGVAMALGLGCPAEGLEEPEGLLERFLTQTRAELQRLPDYVCIQTIERFNRSAPEHSWAKADTLRFEVAMVGDRELYGRPGAGRYEEKSLAEMVGRGSITTGQLGGFARHVFLGSAATFTFRGEGELNGRRAFEYRYDVPPDRSTYRLRSGPAEAIVGFQGEFWIDAATLELLQLEVQAYDIPEQLALAEADTSLRYSRVTIDGEQVVLPAAATFTVAGLDGIEDLNRTRLSGCRRYRVESTLRVDAGAVDGEPAAAPADGAKTSNGMPIPAGALLELALESSLDPREVTLGDRVQARLARPLRDGQEILIPEGTVVWGRLVRLEEATMPFPLYEIGLEFDAFEVEGASRPILATMEEAGPARGLLRQAKRLEPTFSRRRRERMDILVREVQRGQGILHWDARRLPIPQGFRMKWRVEAGSSLPAAQEEED